MGGGVRCWLPWPTAKQEEEVVVESLLAAAVAATDLRHRHRLLDALARQMRSALETAPEDGWCPCGSRLFDPSGEVGVHSHELDYGIGWQGQESSVTQDGVLLVCDPRDYERTTIADVMCGGCHRLYRLPASVAKEYR